MREVLRILKMGANELQVWKILKAGCAIKSIRLVAVGHLVVEPTNFDINIQRAVGLLPPKIAALQL